MRKQKKATHFSFKRASLGRVNFTSFVTIFD